MWCSHVNKGRNLMFPTPSGIHARFFWKQNRVRPTNSTVFIIKWLVSVSLRTVCPVSCILSKDAHIVFEQNIRTHALSFHSSLSFYYHVAFKEIRTFGGDVIFWKKNNPECFRLLKEPKRKEKWEGHDGEKIKWSRQGNATQGYQVPCNSMRFMWKTALVDKADAACKQWVLRVVCLPECNE